MFSYFISKRCLDKFKYKVKTGEYYVYSDLPPVYEERKKEKVIRIGEFIDVREPNLSKTEILEKLIVTNNITELL